MHPSTVCTGEPEVGHEIDFDCRGGVECDFSDLEGYFRCLTPLSPSAAVVRVHVGALAD